MTTPQQRLYGGILGHALGDALGVPVEFMPRSMRDRDPVREMREFGTHSQPAGTWSDDTSMMLCLLEGLLESPDAPAGSVAERFHRWCAEGYWTPHGVVFDIGGTTARAIHRIHEVDDPRDAGETSDRSNGNGSLMRTLPVALLAQDWSTERLVDTACDLSRITHAHPRSQAACAILCLLARHLMLGEGKLNAWEFARLQSATLVYTRFPSEENHLAPILSRSALEYAAMDSRQLHGSGYVLHTLESSVWALLATNTWKDCVFAAINLGDDTDTTGAVAGGLAGVYYGEAALPARWSSCLARHEEIRQLAARTAAFLQIEP